MTNTVSAKLSTEFKKAVPGFIKTTPLLIIGCGSMGKKRLRILQQLGAQNVQAVDANPARVAEMNREFGIQAGTQLEETLAKHQPKVVFIATSTASHLKPALLAARQGCHILIEKPIAHELEGLNELIELARKKQLKILIGCNLRFHPSLHLIQQLVASKKIGRVVCVRFQSGLYLPDWHTWEDYRKGYSANKSLGGGVILDGIQAIDYVMWLLGSPVENVFAFADHLTNLEIDVEDTAEILLKFAGGAYGEVHLDYVQRVYGGGCHVIGEEGTILWDCNDRAVKLFTAKEKKWELFPEPSEFDYANTFKDEMSHFFSSIERDLPLHQDARAGKNVLEVVLAAKESAEINRPVSIPARKQL